MAKTKATQGQGIDAVEAFWKQYPDAPYLLKAGDQILLASALAKAEGIARMAGIQVEKIFNPNLKSSATDATT